MRDCFTGGCDLCNERRDGSEIIVLVVLIDVRVLDEIHIIGKVVDINCNRGSTVAVRLNIVRWQEE